MTEKLCGANGQASPSWVIVMATGREAARSLLVKKESWSLRALEMNVQGLTNTKIAATLNKLGQINKISDLVG